MSSDLLGKDILNILYEINNPASLTAIVDHLSATKNESKTALLESVKCILEGGVRFGFIKEDENKYSAECISATKLQHNELKQIKAKNTEQQIASSQHELNIVASSHDLHFSDENLELPMSKYRKISNQNTSLGSNDDHSDHYEDCYGTRFRRTKRSRSRGAVKRRRSQRRRRHG